MEEIRVLVVEPGKTPYLKTVEHTLENLQAIVGGYIEAVYPFEEEVAVVCDDEGKLKGAPANRVLLGEDGKPYDILCGTFFICGLGVDDFKSISDELADHFTEVFRWPDMFLRNVDGRIIWMRETPTESKMAII